MKFPKLNFSFLLIGLILVALPLMSVLMSKLGRDHGLDMRKELVEFRFEPIRDFVLTNQLGKSFGRSKLHGKVVVASLLPFDGAGNASALAAQLKKIQDEFKEEEDLVLLSLVMAPMADSAGVAPQRPTWYAGVDSSRWQVLSGESSVLQRLVRDDLHWANTGEAEWGIQNPCSQYFALLDTAGRVRNFYAGTDEAEVLKMVEHIALLVPKDHSRRLESR